MRFSTAAFLASLGLVAASPAFGQNVDSGREITVNPVAPGSGGPLLYPGGQYMRLVPRLRQPGESAAPLRLHMPAKRTARAVTTRTAEAAAPRPIPTPKPAAAPKPAPAPKPQIAAAPPPPAATLSSAVPANPYASFSGGTPATNPYANVPGVTAAPKPAPAPKTQVASAAPAPAASTGAEGLTNHTVILFSPKAEEPAESARDAIRFLAGTLTTAMTRPQSRVELMAFGGPKGDKSSDSRRLSLKRALAVRQLLIDAGLPSERINVHAQGGVDDSGPGDRVDVYVRA